MVSLFGTFAEYIVAQGLQIAVLFGAVGLLCFLLRRTSSHIRYLLWMLVIAKCVFPSLMKVSVAVLPEKQTHAAAEVIQPAVEPEAFSTYTDVSVSTDFADFEPAAPVLFEPTLFDRLGEIKLIEWAGIVWIVGVILFFAVACSRAWLLNRKLRSLRRVADFDCGFAGGEGIDVWQIDGIGQPFVWGLLRGSVYVPGNFSECGSHEDRRGILMHEFAHVRRFDAGVNVLQIIAQGLFWFHPLVWFANTMVRREREKCCDEAAIAKLKSVPRDYGNAIIDTLAREYESNIPVPSLAVAGPVKNIEDRLKTIMRPGKKFYTRCGVFALVTILLLAMFALPLGCVLTSRTADYDENLMVTRYYDVPVYYYDGDSQKGELVHRHNKMFVVHNKKMFEKLEQVPVRHIKKEIFPSKKGDVEINDVDFHSDIIIHAGGLRENYDVSVIILKVRHVPEVHEKVEVYVEKLNKEFYEKHELTAANFRVDPKTLQKKAESIADERLSDAKPEMRTYDIRWLKELKGIKFESRERISVADMMGHNSIMMNILDHIENEILPESNANDVFNASFQPFGMNTLMVYHVPAIHAKIEAYLKELGEEFKSGNRKKRPVFYNGFDLSKAYVWSNFTGLPEIFERHEASKSLRLRPDVETISSEYYRRAFYIPDKNVFYVAREITIGPSDPAPTYYGPFKGDPRKVMKDLPESISRYSSFNPGDITSSDAQTRPVQKRLDLLLKEASAKLKGRDGFHKEIAQAINSFLSAVVAGDKDKAAGFMGRQPLQDFYDMRQYIKPWYVRTAAVYSDSSAGLVITSVTKADHGRVGPLVFTVNKRYGKWLIDDIDMESVESTDEEIKRFGKEHKDAGMVRFDKLGRIVKKASPKSKPLMFYGLDLSKGAVAAGLSEIYRIGDLFEERPAGSGSFEIRKDVEKVYSGLDGAVYYVPAKNAFYIQHDLRGSSTYHYYGPFKGDPRKTLKGLPLKTKTKSGAAQLNKELEARKKIKENPACNIEDAKKSKRPLMFYGLDLSSSAVTTKPFELADIFVERPAGSRSYHMRQEVIQLQSHRPFGMVYWVPSKKHFYIQHDPMGSSTLHYYGPFKGNPRKVLKNGMHLMRIPKPGDKQVSIETRFICVSEKFLEDIGLAFNRASADYRGKGFYYKKIEKALEPKASYKFGFGNYPMDQKLAAKLVKRMSVAVTNNIVPGYTDDLGADFLLRMANAHADARTLTAPKITVLDSSPGKISVGPDVGFASKFKEVSGPDGKYLEPVKVTSDKWIDLEVVPKVLKQSGNVEVAFESIISDSFVVTHIEDERGNVLPHSLNSSLKGRFEIPRGKCLLIAGHKWFAPTDNSNNKDKGVEKFFDMKRAPEVEVILILIKPTVIEPDKLVGELVE